MILVKGRHRGQVLKPRQFANDWISATTPDGQHVVVSPLAVELEREDLSFFDQVAGTGTFWTQFALDYETYRFRKIGNAKRGRYV